MDNLHDTDSSMPNPYNYLPHDHPLYQPPSPNPSSHHPPANPSPSNSPNSSSASKPKSSNNSKSKADGRKSSFTAKMRDRQMRNKDPYQSSEDSEEEMWGASSRKRDAYPNEPYETTQKRREAAIILDSPELLMMHAQARCDSIPSTRLYFQKMLAGFHSESDEYPLPGPAVEALKKKARKYEK